HLQEQILTNNSNTFLHIDRINTKNESQDELIAKNSSTITNVSNTLTEQVERLDKVDIHLQEQITTNNTTINNKVDSAVENIAKTDANQDKLISENSKEITVVKNDITRLDKDKASIEYVNIENEKQNIVINNVLQNSSSEIIETMTTLTEKQDAVNAAQDERLDKHEGMINEFGYKLNSMGEELSGGVAAASAIAFMPSPHPGKSMVSGGAATYNGETSVAIGYAATTNNGEYTYRVGATVSSSGPSVVGGGLGYSF
ncbi:YadA C-terminal domain-containing protein, partial [Psychrobacter celer]|uniref:YadA C-terminal domain-containing protein n=1 Tax=Psychrobacter celer TaxID=306572 RepID=UPI003FD5FC6A